MPSFRRTHLEPVPEALRHSFFSWAFVTEAMFCFRLCESSYQKMNATDPKLGFTMFGKSLIVPAMNPIPSQPCKGSLHHPALGQQQPTHGLGRSPHQFQHKVFVPLDPARQTIP